MIQDLSPQELEQALKHRTDDVLRLGSAFEIIIANQRDFARCQDEHEQRMRQMRSELAIRNIKEFNDLIAQRKNL